jgi:hypothetical protein
MKLNRLQLQRPCTFSLVPCAIFLLTLIGSAASAQNNLNVSEQELAYTHTINQRADKIVSALDINDSSKATHVSKIIANQYRKLNEIYTNRDEKIKAIRLQSSDTESLNAEVNKVQEDVKGHLQILHNQYLESLSQHLTAEQVDNVKDGMTYGVVQVTYKGYQEMIPTLTEDQKKQILAWLIEAREFAMDAESSDKKHAWFGKYKGRINNYLSAAGYDLKKASEDWQKQIKADQAAKKSQ